MLYQKKMLGKYAIDNRLINPIFFIDDGITGSTFDRKDFNAAIALVEAGRVKNFVVKDMSRFGRGYLQVGIYTEMLFPDMDVHFVALFDNVDSDKGDNDFTPFRNIMNEWYVRDTSNKVRAVFKAKGLAGESLCFRPPYGYVKDPENPKQWLVDEEAAAVIRQIFRWGLAGLGTTHIAHRLHDAKVDTPATHTLKLGFKTSVKPPDNPYDWGCTQVGKILSRMEYLGHTVNFKTQRKSYKNKKIIFNDPSEYAVFENTHPAIVDLDTFECVQALRAAGKKRRDSSGRLCIFSGLAFCADCGSRMYLSSGASLKADQDNFACSGFRKKKCGHSHYIRVVVLEEIVLAQIQQVTAFANQHEREFVEMQLQNSADKSRKELAAGKRKLTLAENRAKELDNIIQRLYEDNVSGKLTDERFMKLSRGYEAEQQELTAQTESLARQIAGQEQQTLDLNCFLKQVRKYTHVTELTPTLLNELVERIEIHMPDKSSGKRIQPVDVHFRAVGVIGKLDFSKSFESVALAEVEQEAKSGENLPALSRLAYI